MVQMGERARQDNNNLTLIAVVGLLFLPGTFVSSLFGMNFFSFDEENGQQRWQVSGKFWLYWAVTAPFDALHCSYLGSDQLQKGG